MGCGGSAPDRVATPAKEKRPSNWSSTSKRHEDLRRRLLEAVQVRECLNKLKYFLLARVGRRGAGGEGGGAPVGHPRGREGPKTAS